MEAPRNFKRLDLTGRERRLRGAMQAMTRVAANFSRAARRSLPFLVKRRARLAPSSVVFVDTSPAARQVDSPVYEVLFEEAGGPARGSLFFNTDAVAVTLEGVLGGAGGSTAGLGSALSVAQSALVSRVVKQLSEDFVRAVRDEVGVSIRVTSARSIAAGDERDVNISDGLGVDCAFEGLSPSAKISLAMGAEALEAAIKDSEPEDSTAGDPRFAEALHEVPVEVVAELGRVSLGLHRLLTLQVGQVLRLSSAIDDPVVVRVAGVPKFSGAPVISRGQLAIQIKARHED
ncbi:MAG: FliM/FliN family flagellar motor switch protein [Polyangiaceae bacterium]